MLKLHLNNTYDIKNVPVKIGSYQTGEHSEVEVSMDFRIPAGMTRAMLHQQTQKDEAGFYNQLIIGWDGIADENGQPIPCEGATKQAVLKNEAVLYGVLQALTPILLGVAITKNS